MKNRRVCFIEIEAEDKGEKKLKRLDGLAIKGRVNRKEGNSFSEATLSVANLTKSDIEYLTTYTTPYINPKVKKKVNIYAGYENTGWGRIFSGDIIEALPDGMPDTWLNIKAKSLYYNNRTPISYGVNNTSSREIAQSIAKELSLPFEWQATSEKNIGNFNYTGSKAGLIKEFNKLEDVILYEDNGILKAVDKIQKRPENSAKLISKDTGMIGIPQPDELGIKVKCLLDSSLNCSQQIQVKSVKLPIVNGFYSIYELNFDFASREQSFYCDISAKRYGA